VCSLATRSTPPIRSRQRCQARRMRLVPGTMGRFGAVQGCTIPDTASCAWYLELPGHQRVPSESTTCSALLDSLESKGCRFAYGTGIGLQQSANLGNCRFGAAFEVGQRE
jgi:hypothetical protein